MDNLAIIHIGKCGGSTVLDELKFNKIKHAKIHMQEAIYQPNKKYVIVIRNPIKRFISAFNWRYYLVCDSRQQFDKYNNEKTILNKYKNVDNLCNDLKINPHIFNGSPSSGNYIHHLKEDINFYLKNFIKKCPKKQIFGIICTETLKKDMKNVFNIDVTLHKKNNSKYNKNITNENYKILKSYLKNDYIIIHKMYEYGWINDEQYDFLKK
ncbi:MAG: hypothetical protein CL678_11590 [Bdellovibrionaceae bacterium]|nr:hypothetical protein [Pseudobdellovibrionaceae bacterium]